jgi:hypothetical protein
MLLQRSICLCIFFLGIIPGCLSTPDQLTQTAGARDVLRRYQQAVDAWDVETVLYYLDSSSVREFSELLYQSALMQAESRCMCILVEQRYSTEDSDRICARIRASTELLAHWVRAVFAVVPPNMSLALEREAEQRLTLIPYRHDPDDSNSIVYLVGYGDLEDLGVRVYCENSRWWISLSPRVLQSDAKASVMDWIRRVQARLADCKATLSGTGAEDPLSSERFLELYDP